MRQKEDKATLGKADGKKGKTKLCIEDMREEIGLAYLYYFSFIF